MITLYIQERKILTLKNIFSLLIISFLIPFTRIQTIPITFLIILYIYNNRKNIYKERNVKQRSNIDNYLLLFLIITATGFANFSMRFIDFSGMIYQTFIWLIQHRNDGTVGVEVRPMLIAQMLFIASLTIILLIFLHRVILKTRFRITIFLVIFIVTYLFEFLFDSQTRRSFFNPIFFIAFFVRNISESVTFAVILFSTYLFLSIIKNRIRFTTLLTQDFFIFTIALLSLLSCIPQIRYSYLSLPFFWLFLIRQKIENFEKLIALFALIFLVVFSINGVIAVQHLKYSYDIPTLDLSVILIWRELNTLIVYI